MENISSTFKKFFDEIKDIGFQKYGIIHFW